MYCKEIFLINKFFISSETDEDKKQTYICLEILSEIYSLSFKILLLWQRKCALTVSFKHHFMIFFQKKNLFCEK